MSTIFANISIACTSLLLVTLAGVIAGGMLSWISVAPGVGVIVDTILRKQLQAQCTKKMVLLKQATFQNMVMYLMLPVFVLLQLALAWRVYGFMTGVPVEITATGSVNSCI